MTAVERLYALRKRDPSKPMIVLISSIDDLTTFDISLTARQENILKRIWPGKVSVVLHCGSKNFSYLHRGTYSLAIRMPKKKDLLEILNATGPLVAPSANIEGEPPAKNIQEAERYFGNNAYYYGTETADSESSTLIDLTDGVRVLRRGADFAEIAKSLDLPLKDSV
jgi:L-threonylcarbamoyladenylate synthase